MFLILFECTAPVITKINPCVPNSASNLIESIASKSKSLLKVPPGIKATLEQTSTRFSSGNQTTQNNLSVPPGFEPIIKTTDKLSTESRSLESSRTKNLNIPPGFENFSPKPRNITLSTIETNNMRKTRYGVPPTNN